MQRVKVISLYLRLLEDRAVRVLRELFGKEDLEVSFRSGDGLGSWFARVAVSSMGRVSWVWEPRF